jgi:hypothetical protein
MPNGKPGDYPLNDVLDHRRVYGEEADELIRKIAELCSRRELNEWWEREIGWSPEANSVTHKALIHLDKLIERAKSSGWETE